MDATQRNKTKRAKLRKKYREICESLDWTIREYDDGTVEVCKFSPAGGTSSLPPMSRTSRERSRHMLKTLTQTNILKCG